MPTGYISQSKQQIAIFAARHHNDNAQYRATATQHLQSGAAELANGHEI